MPGRRAGVTAVLPPLRLGPGWCGGGWIDAPPGGTADRMCRSAACGADRCGPAESVGVGHRCAVPVAQVDLAMRALRTCDHPGMGRLLAATIAFPHLDHLFHHDLQAIAPPRAVPT